MRAASPNYIWRKRATAAWLAARETQLDARTLGRHAVVEEAKHARLSIEFFCESKRQADELRRTFGGASVRLPADWEEHFFAAHKTKPLRIGRRLIVRNDPDPFSEIPTLIIPAGAAFGTGEHATTAMSLRLLERVTRRFPPGWRMLDAGTGSGILALTGKHFGAGQVVAIDNDPKAIRTARENARSNSLGGVRFLLGDVNRHTQGRFDIVAANLYSELLATALPRFRKCLAPGGRMILSGVMRSQEREITRALRANGFALEEVRRRGKWVALLASVPAPKAKT